VKVTAQAEKDRRKRGGVSVLSAHFVIQFNLLSIKAQLKRYRCAVRSEKIKDNRATNKHLSGGVC